MYKSNRHLCSQIPLQSAHLVYAQCHESVPNREAPLYIRACMYDRHRLWRGYAYIYTCTHARTHVCTFVHGTCVLIILRRQQMCHSALVVSKCLSLFFPFHVVGNDKYMYMHASLQATMYTCTCACACIDLTALPVPLSPATCTTYLPCLRLHTHY